MSSPSCLAARRRDARHGSPALGAVLAALLAAGCGSVAERDGPPATAPDLGSIGDAVPRVEPRSRYGNPRSYVVEGRRYYTLDSSRGYVARGIASWYGRKFHGRRTSSGEPYDMYAMTAAHRTLPIPSYVEVTNLRNGRRVVVRVNDRGPFRRNRLIDLSYVAARKLGIVAEGTGLVEVRAIDPSRPAPAAPLRVSAKPPPAGGTSLYLQVGAFVHRDNAERLRGRLLALGETMVRIREAVSSGRLVYRVQVGPLPGVEQADRVAAMLAARGLDEVQVVLE